MWENKQKFGFKWAEVSPRRERLSYGRHVWSLRSESLQGPICDTWTFENATPVDIGGLKVGRAHVGITVLRQPLSVPVLPASLQQSCRHRRG